MSDGLTLEEMVGKFTSDLLDLFHKNTAGPLTLFLARWGIVDSSNADDLRVITSKIVGKMTSAVMEYCMGTDTVVVGPTTDVGQMVDSVSAGLADYLIHNKLVDLSDSASASGVLSDILVDIHDQTLEHVVAAIAEVKMKVEEG